MTPPSRGHRLMRDAALSLALSCDYAGHFANPRQVTPYTYADSPLTTHRERDREFDAGPIAGAPLINRRLGDDDYLLDHLGRGFSGLYFTGNGEVPAGHRALLQELDCGAMPFRCLLINRTATGGEPGRVVTDPDGSVFEAYGSIPGSFYLVRPDRHVAARWRQLEPAEVIAALHTITGEANE